MNTEPIPVKDALLLCEMAIEEYDKATPGMWRLGEEPDSVDADADFPVACTYQPHLAVARANAIAIVLSRAVMRPMLETFRTYLDALNPTWVIGHTSDYYPTISALKSHYDRTRPEWRTR